MPVDPSEFFNPPRTGRGSSAAPRRDPLGEAEKENAEALRRARQNVLAASASGAPVDRVGAERASLVALERHRDFRPEMQARIRAVAGLPADDTSFLARFVVHAESAVAAPQAPPTHRAEVAVAPSAGRDPAPYFIGAGSGFGAGIALCLAIALVARSFAGNKTGI